MKDADPAGKSYGPITPGFAGPKAFYPSAEGGGA
jgi:hypothetical protein